MPVLFGALTYGADIPAENLGESNEKYYSYFDDCWSLCYLEHRVENSFNTFTPCCCCLYRLQYFQEKVGDKGVPCSKKAGCFVALPGV